MIESKSKNTDIVYLVLSGFQSTIEGVFTDLERAEAYADRFHCGQVIIKELDTADIKVPTDYHVFYVQVRMDEKLLGVYQDEPDEWYKVEWLPKITYSKVNPELFSIFSIYCFAKNEDEAENIACGRLNEWKDAYPQWKTYFELAIFEYMVDTLEHAKISLNIYSNSEIIEMAQDCINSVTQYENEGIDLVKGLDTKLTELESLIKKCEELQG